MTALLLFAQVERAGQVTPLSPAASSIGTLLGAAAIGFGAWLWVRCRREPPDGDATSALLTAGFTWRLPAAGLAVFLGCLVVAGVWIDPQRHPLPFIVIWLLVLIAIMVLLILAGRDLLLVRQRAFRARLELLEDSRRHMEADLRAFRARQQAASPPSFGPGGAHANGAVGAPPHTDQ